MSSTHDAHCKCGFEQEIHVGGVRSNYRTYNPFPHYCKTCGVVDANTRALPVTCPECGSTDIQCYGKAPVSIVDPEILKREGWYPRISAFEFTASDGGHLCPACTEMTMVFSSATRRSD